MARKRARSASGTAAAAESHPPLTSTPEAATINKEKLPLDRTLLRQAIHQTLAQIKKTYLIKNISTDSSDVLDEKFTSKLISKRSNNKTFDKFLDILTPYYVDLEVSTDQEASSSPTSAKPTSHEKKMKKKQRYKQTSIILHTHDQLRDIISDFLAATLEFDAEKSSVLAKVPENIRKDFREIGFVKWGSAKHHDFLPVIQLGPYDVPPGILRSKWMTMFKAAVRTRSPLKRFVFWYGSGARYGSHPNEIHGSYTLMPSFKHIISYEEGCKAGLDSVPERLHAKKLSEIISKSDRQLVRGLKEIKHDAGLEKSERMGWMGGFLEEYEIESDIDDDGSDASGHDDEYAKHEGGAVVLSCPSKSIAFTSGKQANIRGSSGGALFASEPPNLSGGADSGRKKRMTLNLTERQSNSPATLAETKKKPAIKRKEVAGGDIIVKSEDFPDIPNKDLTPPKRGRGRPKKTESEKKKKVVTEAVGGQHKMAHYAQSSIMGKKEEAQKQKKPRGRPKKLKIDARVLDAPVKEQPVTPEPNDSDATMSDKTPDDRIEKDLESEPVNEGIDLLKDGPRSDEKQAFVAGKEDDVGPNVRPEPRAVLEKLEGNGSVPKEIEIDLPRSVIVQSSVVSNDGETRSVVTATQLPSLDDRMPTEKWV